MDYLSIGTEDSDYEILKICNLEKYKISTITVNQGFAKNRENIFNLLTSTIINWVRVYYSEFEDWYLINT